MAEKFKLNRVENGQLSGLIGESGENRPIDAVKQILNEFPYNRELTDSEIEIIPIDNKSFQVLIGNEEYILKENE